MPPISPNWSLPRPFGRVLRQAARAQRPLAPAAPATPAPAPREPAPAARPTAGKASGHVRLDSVDSRWTKDPAFASDGKPIGRDRYMVFGDLRRFYLKGFDVGRTRGGDVRLKFHRGEIPIEVKGLPRGIDGLWAPEVVVQGDKVRLLYCAGRMPDGGGIQWSTFRLRVAEVSLREFRAAAEHGRPVAFKDRGVLFPDQTSFGGTREFGMIDPAYYVDPHGRAWLTYTAVKHAIPGVRPHESFVRVRQVDPATLRPLGPDTAVLDGWSGSRHAGVAEASDYVTIGGKPTLFVSSRAGDIDQRVFAAHRGPGQGRVSEAGLRPVLSPGGEPWKARAVGSTSAAVINGRPFLLHQGLGPDGFSFGWRPLDALG